MSNNKYIHNPLEGNSPELILDLEKTVGDLVSIIIVHRNTPEYLNILLQSIAVCSKTNSYEIIVVDNASETESQNFLTDIQSDVKVLRNNTNLFWSEAANQGSRLADPRSKYLFFMHSDVVILNPGWIDLMINVMNANKCHMLGLESSNYIIGNQRMDFISEWLVAFTKDGFGRLDLWPRQLPLVGNAFVMTALAQGHALNPQIMKNIIAHHYKIFNVAINDFERETENASRLIPQLYQQVQTTLLNTI
jgi:glycosyltransferase involved in cell wall biosynthesis